MMVTMIVCMSIYHGGWGGGQVVCTYSSGPSMTGPTDRVTLITIMIWPFLMTFKIMLTYIDCFPNEMSKDQTTWISSVTILTIMRTFSDKFCDHTRSFNVVLMVLMMLRVTTKTVQIIFFWLQCRYIWGWYWVCFRKKIVELRAEIFCIKFLCLDRMPIVNHQPHNCLSPAQNA